jgi:thiosulfate/3-mercaptopyruvate sulfurtransferase
VSTKESLEYWPQSELVSSEWVKEHQFDNDVKIVEVLYNSDNEQSHTPVPGSTHLIWDNEIDRDTDYLDIHVDGRNDKHMRLLNKIGVKNRRTTIVLYSDLNNWYAAIVFWILKRFGHENVKLLEGGRKKWLLKDMVINK